MFTVEGFLDGTYYTVTVNGAQQAGSTVILRELNARQGEQYAATPTGPAGSLDLSDPASVLGALMGWTRVVKVSGDPPDILHGQSNEPGVVY